MYKLGEYSKQNITHVEIDENMVNTPRELKQVNG
jgi:hypothetical protein